MPDEPVTISTRITQEQAWPRPEMYEQFLAYCRKRGTTPSQFIRERVRSVTRDRKPQGRNRVSGAESDVIWPAMAEDWYGRE